MNSSQASLDFHTPTTASSAAVNTTPKTNPLHSHSSEGPSSVQLVKQASVTPSDDTPVTTQDSTVTSPASPLPSGTTSTITIASQTTIKVVTTTAASFYPPPSPPAPPPPSTTTSHATEEVNTSPETTPTSVSPILVVTSGSPAPVVIPTSNSGTPAVFQAAPTPPSYVIRPQTASGETFASIISSPLPSPVALPPLGGTSINGIGPIPSSTALSMVPFGTNVLPTTFLKTRRPTSTNTPAPLPSSGGAQASGFTGRSSNSSGIISGIVLAVLFAILFAFVLGPRLYRRIMGRREDSLTRAASSVWECSTAASASAAASNPSSSSSSLSSSASTTSTATNDKKYWYFEEEFKEKGNCEEENTYQDAHSVKISIVPPPPVLLSEPEAMPSTPPLSGLYSPSEWAEMLATPESANIGLAHSSPPSPSRSESLGGTSCDEYDDGDDSASLSVYSSRAASPAFVVSTAQRARISGQSSVTGYLVPRGRHSYNTEMEGAFPVTPKDDGLDGF